MWLNTVYLTTIIVSSSSAYANRAEVGTVNSVVSSGLRYEDAGDYSENKQGKSLGGYVKVVRVSDGSKVCVRKIYGTKSIPGIEADAQENYIISLSIEDQQLVVKSEHRAPIRIKLSSVCSKSSKFVY